ncbi:hypothetical protein [Chryseobacterium sp. FH1]|uniref:hypothetical protein n=1 Tax=Chryseobacterium sp. FH1 TaxID=1233951 RepID=UPI0004E308ED|nr:hypothetical protein [Chryseobacterium sp. FH1]KFC19529.1 hypothetical protein IO90_09575 [Chryseobacterium sp. FH1]
MKRSLRNFFVFFSLLIFVYNVSGLGICIDHAQHSKSISSKAKNSKTEKETSISQDDECQCALHMQMNHILLQEPLAIEFPIDTSVDHQIPHSKSITYRCLLDYFSSRAPPSLS